MTDENKVVTLSSAQQRKKNAEIYNKQRDENALQQRMFQEMMEAGLLVVKDIGASVDINSGNQLIARIMCLTKQSAIEKREFMMKFFIEHKMNWTACVTEAQYY